MKNMYPLPIYVLLNRGYLIVLSEKYITSGARAPFLVTDMCIGPFRVVVWIDFTTSPCRLYSLMTMSLKPHVRIILFITKTGHTF